METPGRNVLRRPPEENLSGRSVKFYWNVLPLSTPNIRPGPQREEIKLLSSRSIGGLSANLLTGQEFWPNLQCGFELFGEQNHG
jgi:hypothetical protein